MRIIRCVWIPAGAVLACGHMAAQAAQDGKGSVSPEWVAMAMFLLVMIAAGGLGGFVHGILRKDTDAKSPIRYALVRPFSKAREELGAAGDVFVGIAAAIAILFVTDSLFGLKTNNFTVETILKFMALAVISGYMGSSLLEDLSVMLSKRMVKQQGELEQDKQGLQNLRDRVERTSRARELLSLADAYMRWGKYDDALRHCDSAIKEDPNNPDHYIRKSFVYCERAQQAKGLRQKDKDDLYDAAIQLTDKAIAIDKSFARAYYDRACYRLLRKPSSTKEVLGDLKTAIGLRATLREMAESDPDLAGLRGNADFKKLVGTVAVGEGKGEMEPSLL